MCIYDEIADDSCPLSGPGPKNSIKPNTADDWNLADKQSMVGTEELQVPSSLDFDGNTIGAGDNCS